MWIRQTIRHVSHGVPALGNGIPVTPLRRETIISAQLAGRHARGDAVVEVAARTDHDLPGSNHHDSWQQAKPDRIGEVLA
jgi:hypothetical protein